ncbi:MAG: DUF1553 domain-containing protein, partial [Nodosilinea sp.]
NLHWYYINQDNWPAIIDAQRHDMGVFIISPADKGGHLYHPSPILRQLCAPLSPMVFNDLFCLSHPQVHTLSIGAARPTDFDEHLQTLPLLAQAQSYLAPILDRLHQQAEASLGADWLGTWRVGLPTPDQTPGQINIPVILWLHNMLLAFDMPIPFSTFGRRNVSNVPAQALVLMNDPFVVAEANRWSQRVL